MRKDWNLIRDLKTGRYCDTKVKSLKELVYDPKSPSGLAAPWGEPIGGQDKDGYWTVNFQRKSYKVHRVILSLHGFDLTGKLVDHIDGNPSNNEISNLRVVEPQGNVRNSRKPKSNTSDCKGVSKHAEGKWQVRIRVGKPGSSRDSKNHIHFGLFEDFELAELVAQEVWAKYHGEYARD